MASRLTIKHGVRKRSRVASLSLEANHCAWCKHILGEIDTRCQRQRLNEFNIPFIEYVCKQCYDNEFGVLACVHCDVKSGMVAYRAVIDGQSGTKHSPQCPQCWDALIRKLWIFRYGCETCGHQSYHVSSTPTPPTLRCHSCGAGEPNLNLERSNPDGSLDRWTLRRAGYICGVAGCRNDHQHRKECVPL